eukprot:8167437-Prorocentrum_lima.AAC.1
MGLTVGFFTKICACWSMVPSTSMGDGPTRGRLHEECACSTMVFEASAEVLGCPWASARRS